MATINENTIGGGIDETVGSAQTAMGDLTGDSKTQADGKLTELKGKAEQLLGKAKGVAGDYAGKAREWADNAPEPVQKAREQAQRAIDEYSPRVRQAVQEQPLAVLAGGVALGFVLGALLGGGRRR